MNKANITRSISLQVPAGVLSGGAAAGPGPRGAGCSGCGRLVDQVKYIRNNYFPTGRPSVLYPRAELRLTFLPEAPRPPSETASLVGFDTEKGFTEQHSSSRCKVARVTSPRVPRRGWMHGLGRCCKVAVLPEGSWSPGHSGLRLHPPQGALCPQANPPPSSLEQSESRNPPQKVRETQVGPGT